tara:strand:+ start:213 stop:1094 length:882 start_codon:yes stop_codon:yes gene_type:complete
MIKDGILLVDKPKNITSNNVLQIIKKKLAFKKAGLVGVLDPLASGMLPIVFGEATKFSKFLDEARKQYIVNIRIGVKSNTGDNEGTIQFDKRKVPHLSKDKIIKILDSFLGEYFHKPPMHSSIKIKGRRLYELARKGIEVDRPTKKVKIHKLDLINFVDKSMNVRVVCSKGTYIRTLVEDIGEKLEIYTLTNELRRELVGNYSEKDMIPLDKVTSMQASLKSCFSIDSLVSHIPSISISRDEENLIKNGSKINCSGKVDNMEIIIKNDLNEIVGIGLVANGILSPKRLLRNDQ